MANVTITVDEPLRRKMKRLKQINWSEVAREAFEREIWRREAKEAADKMDKLRIETRDQHWSGAAEIRKWRDRSR